jgi:hypothetical protein
VYKLGDRLIIASYQPNNTNPQTGFVSAEGTESFHRNFVKGNIMTAQATTTVETVETVTTTETVNNTTTTHTYKTFY